MSDDRSLASDAVANNDTNNAAVVVFKAAALLSVQQRPWVPTLGAKRDVSFPLKLYDALMALDAAGLSHIACFQPHGRCFIVLKPAEFVSTVLSVYVDAAAAAAKRRYISSNNTSRLQQHVSLFDSWFQQSKFTSFQRQLNIYGFKRITSGS
jgi:HSF-type DNA-binding